MGPKSLHGPRVKYPYQPALGVKTDFERLLQNFASAGTVRYEKFAECWRELNMSCYCAGRQNDREAREFVEQCLLIATQFWLPPSSFLVRAGAQYLLYGLYYNQLVQPKVKIRVTPGGWRTAMEFQQEARDQQHLDLDYVFQKLVLDKAFQFVVTPEEVTLKSRGVDDVRMIPDNMKDETSMLDEIFSTSNLKQLALVHDQYQKMKLALTGEDATEPDTSLNIVHSDLISGVYKTIQTHKDRQTGSKFQVPDKTTEEKEELLAFEFKSVKKKLKQKAYEQSTSGYRESGRGDTDKDDSQQSEGNESEDNRKTDSTKVSDSWRRSKKRFGLFEKDESEDIPINNFKVQELFSMPDIDSVIPKIQRKTAKSSSEESDNRDTEEDNIKSEDDLEMIDKSDKEASIQEQNKETELKRSNKQKNLKKKKGSGLGNTNNSSTEGNEKKSVINEPNKSKSDSKSKSDQKIKSGLKSKSDQKKGKATPAGQRGKRKGSKEMSVSEKLQKLRDDIEKSEVVEEEQKEKGPTAQEKLHMKLLQRKREARLKSSQSNKKGKKK